MCHRSRTMTGLSFLLSFIHAAYAQGPDSVQMATTQANPLSWTEIVTVASHDPSLKPAVDMIIKQAQEQVDLGIYRRVYRFEDVGKHRSWLDSRALAITDPTIREVFAFSTSDFIQCQGLSNNLPTIAAAAVLTEDIQFQQYVIAQLEEASTWNPLQRTGWSSYDGRPLPPDGKSGSWLATGVGIRGIATAMEIMGDRIDADLRHKLTSLFELEVATIMDDWKVKRQWFIKYDNAITNQWVLPTEGLVRACLTLGVEKHRKAYEFGVANMLKALNTHGEEGVFEEGIGYSMFTVQSFLHTAHAMAVAGDRRMIDHRYLQRYPTWAVLHLQPAGMVLNCFDGTGGNYGRSSGSWRSFLCMMAFCGQSSVANWALSDQFDSPSDDLIGLAYRLSCSPLPRQPAPLFAAYKRGALVVWRDSWKNDASGVWVRGGHWLDQHDHRDRGHVNFILKGKPILIEAGSTDYGDPNYSLLYGSPLGHNTLQIGTFEPSKGTQIKQGQNYEGWQNFRCVAPITVHRLDNNGGSIMVDGSKCITDCEIWHRYVDWTKAELTVRDEVHLPDGQPNVVRLLWHLGTEKPVEIINEGNRSRVTYADAKLEFEADVPFAIHQQLRPDATIASQSGHQHTCLELLTSQPSTRMRCTMRVRCSQGL